MKKLRHTELKLSATYAPAMLLDNLWAHMSTTSDYALAMALELPPPTISKIRTRRANVTAGVLLRMHDVSKVPVDTLREWMGLEPFVASAKSNPVE